MTSTDLLSALHSAFAHRLRAALTVLGIVIGSGSIVLLASIIRGGEGYIVHANQEASDSDILEAHRDEPPSAQKDRTTRPLTRHDAAAIGRAPSLSDAMVTSESVSETFARWSGRRKRVAVVSAGPSTAALYRLTIARGRSLDGDDVASGRRVCVVGHEVYEELLRAAPSLGDIRLEVDGHAFSVVGVLARKPLLGATTSTELWDRRVLIPHSTYDALHAPSHDVQKIYVRTAGDRTMARASMDAVLLRRHLGVANFALRKDESGGMEQTILTVIQILLLGTGAMALLASGINIMNVMLVTVSERTREIGLRRAIGATPRSILVQFLLEATILSATGAALGLVGGTALAWVLSTIARGVLGHWDFVISSWSLALGAGLSIVVGLVFGAAPAWRAARILPMDALRSE